MASDPKHHGVRWQTSLTLAFVLETAIAAGLWLGLNIHPWLAWVAGCSIVTFTYYGMDKWSATRGWRRTPEFALWLLILSGGVVGGWLGQILFHHKTRKLSFWLVLTLATAVHGAVTWMIWDRF